MGSKELPSIPMVNGLDCPACGHPTLILGDGGYITCSLEGCPNPDYAESSAAWHTAEVERAKLSGVYLLGKTVNAVLNTYNMPSKVRQALAEAYAQSVKAVVEDAQPQPQKGQV